MYSYFNKNRYSYTAAHMRCILITKTINSCDNLIHEYTRKYVHFENCTHCQVQLQAQICFLTFLQMKLFTLTIHGFSCTVIEETINIRTPAIIGRSYTETKPRRYWVMPLKGRWSPPYPATEKWSSIVNPRLR